MTIARNTFLLLLTPLMLLAGASPARAASNGIRDDGHFFSSNAISDAQQVIDQIEQRHQKDVLIETFPTIPDDQKQAFDQQGKDRFFSQWASSRARSQGVNGIYILITKDPGHLEMAVGNRTQKGFFTLADRNSVRDEMLAAFKQKNFDQGLVKAVRDISQRMDSNVRAAGVGSGTANQGTPAPTGNYPSFPRQQSRSWGLGGIACILIAVVLFIVLIRGIFGRSGGTYYGGGYPQQGGGYQQGGYYPPQGGYGYGGGGGGGFGRGFLGGLLGGALGGYAADRYMHGNQQQTGGGYVPPASGGGGGDFGGGADTSFDSSGGDFGGGGGGGGGDWGGGGGGGGDFGGGGGGDSGGGGGGGGDF